MWTLKEMSINLSWPVGEEEHYSSHINFEGETEIKTWGGRNLLTEQMLTVHLTYLPFMDRKTEKLLLQKVIKNPEKSNKACRRQ